MAFLRTIVRLLTGRIAFERRALLLAIEMAPQFAEGGEYRGAPEYVAQRLYYFLLNDGRFPE